jgi:hypothetical protein
MNGFFRPLIRAEIYLLKRRFIMVVWKNWIRHCAQSHHECERYKNKVRTHDPQDPAYRPGPGA